MKDFTGASSPEANITVTLVGTNGSVTTTTDANGNYSFSNVAPGSYSVKFPAPPTGYQYVNTADNTTTLPSVGAASNSFTVSSGSPVTGIDSGIIQQAEVKGSIWLDTNADGIQNGSEANYTTSAVSVSLLVNGVPTLTQNTTNGSYDFTVIPTPNTTYSIQVTNPDGSTYILSPTVLNNSVLEAVNHTATTTTSTDSNDFLLGQGNLVHTDSFQLLPGQVLSNIDAGFYQNTTVSGTAFVVKDFTGASSPEANITVTLVGTNGSVTTTTDANGNYSFSNVAPGSYSVKFPAPPTGYQYVNTADNTTTLPSVGAASNSFTVSSGSPVTGIDSGIIQQAEVKGSIWLDTNADGIQNGSEANYTTSAVSVSLLVNGVPTLTQNTTNGSYDFTVIPTPNTTYSIQVTSPSGTYFLSPTVLNNGVLEKANPTATTTTSTDSNDFLTIGTNNQTNNFQLLPGQVLSNIDAGFYQKAALDGTVWLDSNGNGKLDATETLEKGLTVTLFDANGKSAGTTTTDTNGHYSFSNLTPGNYSVQVTAPNNLDFTTEATGTPGALANVSYVNDSGTTNTITLTSGLSDHNINAGLVPCTVNLGDKVWRDINANGLQDSGETGIAGVTVTLVNLANNSSISTTTDSTGHYQFANVLWGTYKEIITVPNGYSLTLPNVGNDNTINSDFSYQQVLGTTNLLSNGNIQYTQNGCTGSFGSITGWQGDGGNFEVLTASKCGVTGQTGSYVVQLQPNSGYDDDWGSGISQSVQTTAGQSYHLSVDVAAHAGGTTNPVEVLWQGQVVGTITPSSTTFKTYTFDVTGTGGSNQLEFIDLYSQNNQTGGCGGYGGFGGSSNYGAYIDNVQLVTNSYVAQTGTITVNSCTDNLNIDAGLNTASIKVQEYISANEVINCGGQGQSSDYWGSNCNAQGSYQNNDWSNTGCKSNQTFNSLFGTNCSAGNQSLYTILHSTGSGQQAFLKEAVSAYLNASDCNVNYALTKNQVCAETKYAITCGEYNDSTNELSYQNHLGCSTSSQSYNYGCGGQQTSTETVNVVISDANSAQNIQLLNGGTATYTYIVTNTGDVPLSNVQLADNSGTATTSSTGILAPGASWTYTSTATVHSGLVVNTSTVTAVDNLNHVTTVTASDSVNYTGVNCTSNSAAVSSNDNCTIGNQVWVDNNHNGVLNSGDCGLSGVTVTLEQCINNVFQAIANTTTDNNGHYEFTNLCAGQYEVVVQAVNGYGFSAENACSNAALSSCVNSSGVSAPINLAAGQQDFNACVGLDPLWHH